jgi:phenylalanyl-tRNA synthetase beta chain
MTVSYQWLSEYLPVNIEPGELSKILTSIGLEVESLEVYESVKGGLKGLLVGEVIECIPHPQSDKLKITRVDINAEGLLQIVCGAHNVAAGQKVIVATAGTTIYPLKSGPVTLKIARIRGVESEGMICAEDEIGLGEDHEGILVLPGYLKKGSAPADYFKPYTDYLFEIGLTPNHMDAMSHLGVARDVCAYLSHRENRVYHVKYPSFLPGKPATKSLSIDVSIENTIACQRYSAVSMSGIKISDSPKWMQDKLKAIGVRPINNVVDITNFVLHEMGQPLHAFDAKEINGNKIIVKNAKEGTDFITLDEKERKLSAEDLLICDAEKPLCIAGIFGGLGSGIKDSTTAVFLESAWFNPLDIRRSSSRLGLRTDSASHFEKGMDISNTVNALQRAVSLLQEFASAEMASDIIDIYPAPKAKIEVGLSYAYLKKLSGKDYSPDSVKHILSVLGFEIRSADSKAIQVSAPYHKPDISLPADLVEEIMRMDGYDRIDIPSAITISPSVETGSAQAAYKEKISDYLAGSGFYEIFTNSITNSAFFKSGELVHAVKMINNLSSELNVMRPSMLETGLESVGYNLNRKNTDLRFFEFGKTYYTRGIGDYVETNHLCLYITGKLTPDSWKSGGATADIYYLKGICSTILQLAGIPLPAFSPGENDRLESAITLYQDGLKMLDAGMVNSRVLQQFDIRQPVFYADIQWDALAAHAGGQAIQFRELPKPLPVHRDLSMVVDKSIPYAELVQKIQKIRPDKLQDMQLFDIFESEKLGADKKSLAMSFRFLDQEKTLTDMEVDQMMNSIMQILEKELHVQIRKGSSQ